MPTLPTVKQAALDLVERLNDDVTFEEIIYELYALEKIQRGMQDAAEERTVSHDETYSTPLSFGRSS